MGRDAPITSIPATGRYEEIAYWRAELEKQKEENERLRQRVRELEAVNRKEGREKERGRGAVRREGSLDTTVSVQGSVLSGGDEKGASPKKAEMDGLTGMMKKSHLDDEVVVGESAASVAAE